MNVHPRDARTFLATIIICMHVVNFSFYSGVISQINVAAQVHLLLSMKQQQITSSLEHVC